ncbi:MAG: peptide ABC transporter substrate-binding protein [Gemmatimonadaceae bacterium]
MRFFVSSTGALLFALSALACSDRAQSKGTREPGGTIVISTTADPGTLFPPLIENTQGKQIAEQIYDYLADVGPEMNTRGDRDFRAQLTDGWRWSADSLSIAFHINPRARWHDGKSVSARDVTFTFALNKNPALAGSAMTELGNIDSVTARDSLTAVFWFHRRGPTQFLDAAAQMLILPAHQLENIAVDKLRERSPAPIGTGRFRLGRWDKGSSVEIIADSANYRGRARLDRVIWTITPEFSSAVVRLFSGDADLFDALRAENVSELRRHPNLRVAILPGTDYTFLQFNLRDPANNALPHPLFGDRALRRAIAMAVNRRALVTSVLDSLGSVALGPTVRAFPTTDPAIPQLRFDSAQASRTLDSLGWNRTSPVGVRARNGRRLAFTLLVPTSSTNRVKMAVQIQAQLRRAGIRVDLEPMESSAMGALEDAHKFDAALGDWHMGASPDGTRQAWSTVGIGKEGVNYGSYSDPRFDAQLDSALEASPDRARAAFTAAYATINEDAPAVWLYEPKTVLGIDRRIKIPWMRPDAWWADLGEWYIPPAERRPRDRLLLSR